MRGHVRVDLGEVGLVDQFDDEHGRSTCMNRTAPGKTYTTAFIMLRRAACVA